MEQGSWTCVCNEQLMITKHSNLDLTWPFKTLTWHYKIEFCEDLTLSKMLKRKGKFSEHSNKSDQVVVLNFIELLDKCLLTQLLEPGFAPFQMLFLVNLQLLPNPPQSMMGPRSGKHSNKDIRDDMAYHQKLKTPAQQITTERQQWGIFMNMIHRDFPPAVTPQHRLPDSDPRAPSLEKGGRIQIDEPKCIGTKYSWFPTLN